MEKKLFLWLFLSVVICGGGCSSKQQPHAKPISISSEKYDLQDPGRAKIKYLDISPGEDIILIDGRNHEFQVDIVMAGPVQSKENWEVRVEFNHLRSQPFLLSTVGKNGQMDISSALTWSVPVRGKFESAQVDIYYVTHSNARYTTNKTLVRSMRRSYNVICDRNEFFVVLMVKKTFSLCREYP